MNLKVFLLLKLSLKIHVSDLGGVNNICDRILYSNRVRIIIVVIAYNYLRAQLKTMVRMGTDGILMSI